MKGFRMVCQALTTGLTPWFVGHELRRSFRLFHLPWLMCLVWMSIPARASVIMTPHPAALVPGCSLFTNGPQVSVPFSLQSERSDEHGLRCGSFFDDGEAQERRAIGLKVLDGLINSLSWRGDNALGHCTRRLFLQPDALILDAARPETVEVYLLVYNSFDIVSSQVFDGSNYENMFLTFEAQHRLRSPQHILNLYEGMLQDLTPPASHSVAVLRPSNDSVLIDPPPQVIFAGCLLFGVLCFRSLPFSRKFQGYQLPTSSVWSDEQALSGAEFVAKCRSPFSVLSCIYNRTLPPTMES